MTRSVLAIIILLSLPPAVLAEDLPVLHDLSLQIVPERNLLVVTDKVTVPGPEGVRELTFRVRREFELLDAAVAEGRSVRIEKKEKETLLHIPVAFQNGRGVFRLQYRMVLAEKVRKSDAFSFVAGDHSSGIVSEKGIYLPGGSGWYPECDAMIQTTVRAQFPSPWRIVSQGEKVEEKDLPDPAQGGGNRVSKWRESLPSDGLSLVGGRYEVSSKVHEGVVLSTYLFPGHAGMAQDLLESTAAYLTLYTRLLGPYPFKKFDIVENFFTSGFGMPSYTLLGSRVLDVIQRIGLRPGFIDHELVHNWWGNSVYIDFSQGNWCEGATTYCANYYGGRELASMEKAADYRRLAARKYSLNITADKEYPLASFISKTEDFDNDIGYGKSSMFFHLLRRITGDKAFWDAMKAVAKSHCGRRASWTDFRLAFEKASGRPLTRIFDQWLKRPGLPRLSLQGSIQDKGWLIRGKITAVNNLDPALTYDLPVPLRVCALVR